MMEGRDYGQLKQTDQHGDRIASENAYQKPAGNSRRLNQMTPLHLTTLKQNI